MPIGDDADFGKVPGRPARRDSGPSRWRRALLRLACWAFPLVTCVAGPLQRAMAAEDSLLGVWLMAEKAAIQVFECGGMICGRIVWLRIPLDSQGLLRRDTLNPDPALRQRQVCGPTIIWNLRATDANRWEGGWFYNPDDGRTYSAMAELKSADTIVVRIYVGLPIFGENRTLTRIPRALAEGWC